MGLTIGQKLSAAIDHFEMGVHTITPQERFVISRFKEELSSIKSETDPASLALLNHKLITILHSYLLYLNTCKKGDLKGILTRQIDRGFPKSLNLEFHEILSHGIECYEKNVSHSYSTQKKLEQLKDQIGAIFYMKLEEKSEAIQKLKEECVELEKKAPKELKKLLAEIRLSSAVNKVQKNITLFESKQEDFPPLKTISPVTVYIWLPKGNFPIGSVGHVAIKTAKGYKSFWPTNDSSHKVSFKRGVNSTNHSYFDDLRDEGRPPDFKITLYSLDSELMDLCFETLKDRKWQACAGKEKSLEKEAKKGFLDDSSNCSIMSATLLSIGGIRDLFPEGMYTKFFPVASTNKLENLRKQSSEKLRRPSQPERVQYHEKSCDVIDLGGYVGYTGIFYWELFSQNTPLPNNFLQPLLMASKVEKARYGNEIAEFLKVKRAQKQAIDEKIEVLIGENFHEKIWNYKLYLIKVNAHLDSLGSRLKSKKAQPKIYEQQRELQALLTDLTIRYKNISQKLLENENLTKENLDVDLNALATVAVKLQFYDVSSDFKS